MVSPSEDPINFIYFSHSPEVRAQIRQQILDHELDGEDVYVTAYEGADEYKYLINDGIVQGSQNAHGQKNNAPCGIPRRSMCKNKSGAQTWMIWN